MPDSGTPWTAAHQPSVSSTISWSFLKSMSTESVIPSNHVILCRTLLFLLSIFHSIRVFSSGSVLHIRWPKYWSFIFSISTFNEYSRLISLGWTDLISFLSKGHSRLFSSTTFWKHKFFGFQPSLWSNSHICTCLDADSIDHSNLVTGVGWGEAGLVPTLSYHCSGPTSETLLWSLITAAVRNCQNVWYLNIHSSIFFLHGVHVWTFYPSKRSWISQQKDPFGFILPQKP